MPKILAIDYGKVRTGLAITDDLQMIASPLKTVETKNIMVELAKILQTNKISIVVVGEAKYADGKPSEITELQAKFVDVLLKKFPGVHVVRIDERYTSKMAAQALVASGMRKSQRQKKENLDMVSAAIILQSYLDMKTE